MTSKHVSLKWYGIKSKLDSTMLLLCFKNNVETCSTKVILHENLIWRCSLSVSNNNVETCFSIKWSVSLRKIGSRVLRLITSHPHVRNNNIFKVSPSDK